MNRQENEEWIDELISRTINATEPQFNAEKWKQKHPKEFQILLSRAAGAASIHQPNTWTVIFKRQITKFAAAAVLVMGLAIGALMGQDTWRSPDIPSVGDSQMAQVEPTAIYNLDYLTSAPRGSPADAYLTLVAAANGKER